ncbi:histone-lysine N-methyltransferase SETMAR [Trichonephila clavipes]|nr:histone-lysine N-methyltransferase SETMAR [Trichonephila clavipes]
MKTSSVEFISRSPTPSPMKSKQRRFSSGLDEKGKKEDVPLRTAYSQAGRLWHAAKSNLRAQAQQIQTRTETLGLLRESGKEKDGALADGFTRRALFNVWKKEQDTSAKFFFDKSENARLVAEIANGVYGVDNVTANSMQFWFRRFCSGIFDVKDAHRTSRLIVDNVDKIAEIREIDRHVSSGSIA